MNSRFDIIEISAYAHNVDESEIITYKDLLCNHWKYEKSGVLKEAELKMSNGTHYFYSHSSATYFNYSNRVTYQTIA